MAKLLTFRPSLDVNVTDAEIDMEIAERDEAHEISVKLDETFMDIETDLYLDRLSYFRDTEY